MNPNRDYWIVICRDDRISPRKPGPYVLATRHVFQSEAMAKYYTRTVAKSRRAIVVGGRWHQLRLPEGIGKP